VKGKGDYRNAPVHSVAALTKMSTENPMFYDPSHINGPKGADIIVKDTINAMKMVLPDGSPLYDGVLIEVGTSSTDTEQHISVDEYLRMIDELSKFRTLVEP
jgi:3-deoxy-D-arabino-heptulosonate 7-phosphate (DAHP) synthase